MKCRSIVIPKVHLNSISGLRAFARASRTCRALGSPYFFKPLRCEFKELEANPALTKPPVITLSATDNFKTLKFHWELQPGQERLKTITQVLSVENGFESFEYLPHASGYRLSLPPPALDLLSCTLPMLSRLVLDVGNFSGYSTSWDKAYRKAKIQGTRYSYVDLPHPAGMDAICAIARFKNLNHLTLYFKLRYDEVVLMHPTPGQEAVREVFESIQRRKQGQNLVRFQVVFRADSDAVLGRYNWTSLSTLSTTMTIVRRDNGSCQAGKRSQCDYICDNLRYGKVIERRKRAYRLYGEAAWMSRLGSVQENLLQGKYTAFPWNMVMDSLMYVALSPSYLIFEDGKRVRFEPSLVNVELKCHKDKVYRRRSARLAQKVLPFCLVDRVFNHGTYSGHILRRR